MMSCVYGLFLNRRGTGIQKKPLSCGLKKSTKNTWKKNR